MAVIVCRLLPPVYFSQGDIAMKQAWFFALLGVGAFALAFACGEANADDKKGDVVEVDGLKAAVPAEWKKEKPSNRLRLMQFRLPKQKNDNDDAELVVFQDITGTPEQNIKRWKDTFNPPEGKKIEDVAKVTEIMIGGSKAPYLDLSGTYKYKFPPFDPNAKVMLKPDYRMLGIQYDGKNNTYHFKLVGPAKTVEYYKKGFDEWLAALK
jgi:hypothetical protein